MAKQVADGLALPCEDEVADEYALAQGSLKELGYEQYEVSNFARKGSACRHNWNIWRGEDYWGFGVGAVGTVEGVRHSHGDDLQEYIRLVAGGASPVLHRETLTPSIRAWEKLMLGLRTREGVLKEEVDRVAAARRFSQGEKFHRLLQEGFLSLSDGRYRVASKGYFVMNGILETLVA